MTLRKQRMVCGIVIVVVIVVGFCSIRTTGHDHELLVEIGIDRLRHGAGGAVRNVSSLAMRRSGPETDFRR